MAGNVKLMTSAGGGVVLDTATTTATDVTVKVPVTGVNNGTLVCSDSSGNVGIGTSSPGAKLDVNGSVVMNGVMTIKSSGTTVGYFGDVDGASNVQLRSQNAIEFKSGGNTERMRINSSGNLLVGTTSEPQTADGLAVKGKATATGNQWNFQVWTQNGNFTFGCRDDYYVRSQAIYDRTAGGGANVFVDSSGYLYRSTSSLRYKTDVRDYDKGLHVINSLRPVYYKSKVVDAEGNAGNTQFAGLIAEEIADAGLEEFVVRNSEGQPDAIHYANMVSLCIKAIQELSAKNDALEARIAASEAK